MSEEAVSRPGLEPTKKKAAKKDAREKKRSSRS